MKMALAALLAIGLAGCADSGSMIPLWSDDDATPVRTAEPAPPAEAAPQPLAASTPAPAASQPLSLQTAQLPTRAQPAAVSDHCRKIAKQRAGDAAYGGEDPDTQEAVYNRTYADCVAWDSKHAS